MLDKKVVELLNEQITREFYSAYLYLDFSNYYEDAELNGYANWFMVQAQEERDHALLFIKYLQLNDEKVVLGTVNAPNSVLNTYKDPLVASLAHERMVTKYIHNIYDAAYEVKDFRTMQFLDWFVKEQCEEEDTCNEMIKRYDLFASDPKGLYNLDAEYGARVYAAPTLTL